MHVYASMGGQQTFTQWTLRGNGCWEPRGNGHWEATNIGGQRSLGGSGHWVATGTYGGQKVLGVNEEQRSERLGVIQFCCPFSSGHWRATEIGGQRKLFAFTIGSSDEIHNSFVKNI